MTNGDLSAAMWRKSSHSGDAGDCVEVAVASDGGRYVRDSKDRSGQTHYFKAAEWTAFIRGVRDGEFD